MSLYLLAQFGLPLACFIAFGITKQPILALVFVLVCFPTFARLVTLVIGSLVIKTIPCPGCGFEMDAVDRWVIGGYTDHREQHYLWARNPISGNCVGQVDCPHCGATILVR